MPWTTPLVTIVRNSYVHVQNRLCMPIVPNSEAEILNILKLCRIHKVMDGSPLTHKFANGRHAVIQGQDRLTELGLPRGYHL